MTAAEPLLGACLTALLKLVGVLDKSPKVFAVLESGPEDHAPKRALGMPRRFVLGDARRIIRKGINRRIERVRKCDLGELLPAPLIATECCGFDVDRLAEIAAQIGPKIASLAA